MYKRSILFLGIAGFLLGSGWLLWYLRQAPPETESITLLLPEEADRQAFLTQQGFSECHCIRTETVQLPATPDAAYADYVALQDAQGLPLAESYGASGICCTYATENTETSQYIQLLLDDTGKLIGAMRYDSTNPTELEPIL